MTATSLAAPFLAGLADDRIRFQRCGACGKAQRLARYACTACGATDLRWEDATGRGTVFAVTEVKRAPTDAFRALVPYRIALIDLDEGARLMAHAQPGLSVGDRVSLSVYRLGEQALIRAAPA